MANGRCYIGQTTNLQQRYKQHKPSPASRMRSDVSSFLPFEDYFVMDELDVAADKQQADRLEQLIRCFASTSVNGYKSLQGAPGKYAQYWFFKRKNIV